MIALGLHSHCSLMRGTASPRALCRRVRQLGYTAAALTDTNNLYGLWPFLAACADEGLTPVIGAELRSTSGRLFALVRDRAGFRHLSRLLTALHADSALDLGQALADQHAGLQAIQPVGEAEVLEIRYPVEAYPTKVASHDLEKTPVVEGILRGIKGQYLILDTGVINLRKYTAYQVAVLTE